MKVTQEEFALVYFLLALAMMSRMLSRDQARSIVETLRTVERPANLEAWVTAEIKKLEA